jgi:anti-sigma factor RsiW
MSQRPTRQDIINAYLDGRLSDAQRAAVEKHIDRDADLRREVEQLERMEDSLRDRFGPDQAPAIDLPAPPRRLFVPLSAAAIILLALLGGVYWYMNHMPGQQAPSTGLYAQLSPEQAYAQTVAAGFQPGWVCEPKEFRETFANRFGQPLALAPDTAATQMLGLSYMNVLSADTIAMLARVDGQPVMVFVDRADAPAAKVPPGSDLTLFERTIGGLMLYELTPLDRPAAMDLIQPVEGE